MYIHVYTYIMTTKVTKWGNSLGIRIPKSLGIKENTEVTFKKTKSGILLETKNNKKTLEDLLDRVTKDNLHNEVDFGNPVGKEVW